MLIKNFIVKTLCSYPQCTAYEVLHSKRPTTVLRDAIIEDVIDFDIDEYAIDMVEGKGLTRIIYNSISSVNSHTTRHKRKVLIGVRSKDFTLR